MLSVCVVVDKKIIKIHENNLQIKKSISNSPKFKWLFLKKYKLSLIMSMILTRKVNHKQHVNDLYIYSNYIIIGSALNCYISYRDLEASNIQYRKNFKYIHIIWCFEIWSIIQTKIDSLLHDFFSSPSYF